MGQAELVGRKEATALELVDAAIARIESQNPRVNCLATPMFEEARRAAALVRRYADMPLGTTDPTVIAVTERLGISEVATLDRRHFTVV